MSGLLSYIEEYKVFKGDTPKTSLELELRFNRNLTKKKFEDVYEKLINYGFTRKDAEHSLRCSIKEDNIRVQINGLDNISSYCSNHIPTTNAIYMKKTKIKEENNENYNFKTALSKEQIIDKSVKHVKGIIYNWKQKKKFFRFMYRISLKSDTLKGFQIDFSIVKTSNNILDIFHKPENYEVELEITNKTIETKILEENIKKTIKYILMGIQNTNFPINNLTINKIKDEYISLFSSSKKNDKSGNLFIGPNSITLQQTNLMKDSKVNNTYVNEGYCVTDKADGERRLLYIGKDNGIYLISNKLEIVYTGINIEENYENLKGLLLDGEFIKYDKDKNIINTYAAFDVYFVSVNKIKTDVRKNEFKSQRYKILRRVIDAITKKQVNKYNTIFNFNTKKFYFTTDKRNIYNNCKILLNLIDGKDYIYNTDGLIFTHETLGVGMEDNDDTIKNNKYTWQKSFKWKPPEFNTIDFKVKILNKDNVPIFNNDGVNMYKNVELYVLFNKSQEIIDHQTSLLYETYGVKKPASIEEDKFIPTEPYEPEAYNAYFKLDFIKDNEGKLYTEEGEIIEDNYIVECKYQKKEDKRLCWVPLRLRSDKVKPNGFSVANSNWYSIHHEVTKKMLINKDEVYIKNDIDNDKPYYNKGGDKANTKIMRDFHNKGVKSLLYEIVCDIIKSEGTKNPSIIDYTVGKGGDIFKYRKNGVKYVLGIDLSIDNINNKEDGACKRYLDLKAKQKINLDTKYIFIQGNTGKLILKDDFSENNTRSSDIMKILFGKENIKKYDYISKGQDLYSRFTNGFDVGTIQFGLHYMFKDIETLNNFARNCSETIKLNGYLIGTCYDGKKVFDLLNTEGILNENDTYELRIDDVKLWHIKKKYEEEYFNDDETSLGYTISVYQDSINNEIDEYLVNFNYFKKIMEDYGFTCEDKYKDGKMVSIDTFKKIYKMNDNEKNYKMSKNEKIVSFLNNYFIFKKTNIKDPVLIYNHNLKHIKRDNNEIEKMKIKTSKAKFISREKIII